MAQLEVVKDSAAVAKLKAKAQQHFNAIKKAGVMESTNSLRIGWNAFRLKEENLFGALGFETETEAREAAGVGSSTWYSTIRLAEAFYKLSEADFTSMRLTNAQALADMPESKRFDKQWVLDAAEKSIKEFAAMVDEAMNGKARASDTKESQTSLKIGMTKSRRTVIETKVKEFAKAHGIKADDMGKVIEVMCVETTGQATMSGAIANAIQRIKRVKKLAHSSELSADEALVRIETEMDEMVLEFNAALEQVKHQEAA
jgi:hypothetical protein